MQVNVIPREVDAMFKGWKMFWVFLILNEPLGEAASGGNGRHDPDFYSTPFATHTFSGSPPSPNVFHGSCPGGPAGGTPPPSWVRSRLSINHYKNCWKNLRFEGPPPGIFGQNFYMGKNIPCGREKLGSRDRAAGQTFAQEGII